jgi:hypothetical protein
MTGFERSFSYQAVTTRKDQHDFVKCAMKRRDWPESVYLEQAAKTGLHSAESLVRERLADFLSSMRRGLVRDVKNTREYYQALGTEMQAGLSHPNLTEPQRQERLAKIAELPAELTRKILDVQQKYQVRDTISAFRLLVDVVQLLLELKYRKFRRSVRVTWNPLTRHLDPLV